MYQNREKGHSFFILSSFLKGVRRKLHRPENVFNVASKVAQTSFDSFDGFVTYTGASICEDKGKKVFLLFLATRFPPTGPSASFPRRMASND